MQRPDEAIQKILLRVTSNAEWDNSEDDLLAYMQYLEQALRIEQGANGKLGAEVTRLEELVDAAPRQMHACDVPEGWERWSNSWKEPIGFGHWKPFKEELRDRDIAVIARPPQSVEKPDVGSELAALIEPFFDGYRDGSGELGTETVKAAARQVAESVAERFKIELRDDQ